MSRDYKTGDENNKKPQAESLRQVGGSSELDKLSGIDKVHNFITGQQNTLYSAWKKANPNKILTIDIMADIEIQAMKNVGIAEDVATGWVIKALEDLKAQGINEIKNIPWNGVNVK